MRMRDYLESRGESQRDFCRRTGMLPQTLNQIIRRNRASLESAILIEAATKGLVSFGDLLGDQHEKDRRSGGNLKREKG